MVKEKIRKIVMILCVIILISFMVTFLVKVVPKMIENESGKIGNNADSKIFANSSTAFLRSGDVSGVQTFLQKASESEIYLGESNESLCYNVTPVFVKENSEFQIFKFSDTGETFLVYENEIYELGNSRNGNGTISFALADFDKNGKQELYFSYTWDTGVYRTNIAYFDSNEKIVKNFNNLYYKDEEVILVENNDELCAVHADFTEYIDNTNFKLSAGKLLARISLENGEIILKEVK